eukprot:NODE_1562_length_1458_cov_41.444778_g1481_i0.p1 GENE.NODE_1562_length_1458_cov_41.444778_g1481_i0~~NODE_1562_length_1458_cov_41.444778_g1481_i0.p1  ORF type:complete len:473 (+),score=90.34 NODE_1562_length_1458_cov_41.444778_g1481_i0:207-1421(+)
MQPERFVDGKEWKDRWPGLVWLVGLACLLVTSVIGLLLQPGLPWGKVYANMVDLMILTGLLSFGMAISSLFLLRLATHRFIPVVVGLLVLTSLVVGLLSFILTYWGRGLVIYLSTAVFCLWLWRNYEFLRFAVLFLDLGSRILTTYQGSLMVSVGGGMVMLLYMVVWACCVRLAYSAGHPGWMIVLVPLFLWSTQSLQYIAHTVGAGLTGWWYFSTSTHTHDPTPRIFSRSLVSFGSICRGATLVGLAKTAEMFSNGVLTPVFGASCDLLAAYVDIWGRHWNLYAFTHVAIYDHNYRQSSQDTQQLIQQNCLSAVVRKTLILPFLAFLCVQGGFLIASMVALASPHQPSVFFPAWLCSGAMLAFCYAQVEASVLTVIVCYAEAPQYLQAVDPSLAEKILLNSAV